MLSYVIGPVNPIPTAAPLLLYSEILFKQDIKQDSCLLSLSQTTIMDITECLINRHVKVVGLGCAQHSGEECSILARGHLYASISAATLQSCLHNCVSPEVVHL